MSKRKTVADRIHDAEESYRRAPIMNARRAEPDPAVFFASLPTGTEIELRESAARSDHRPGVHTETGACYTLTIRRE